MKIANYVLKYTKSIDGPLMIPKKKIDSTMKWVEYSLDIVDMQKMLMSTSNLKDKYQKDFKRYVHLRVYKKGIEFKDYDPNFSRNIQRAKA